MTAGERVAEEDFFATTPDSETSTYDPNRSLMSQVLGIVAPPIATAFDTSEVALQRIQLSDIDRHEAEDARH